MNILAHVRFYPPHSNCGSDRYLHTVLKFLKSRGHDVKVMLGEGAKGCPYVYDGIEVVAKPLFGVPYIQNSDVVITHLDFTADCCNMVKNKPIVWLMHNTFNQATVRRCADRVIVVYNSEAAKKEIEYPNRSFVLPVPVDIDWYNVERENADCITLINLNEMKGGDLFWKLAEELPEYRFLGVKGSYGEQWVNRSLPNVEIMDNTDDIREVYKRTRILIMPSSYESWGRTATEAAASGIPVICTDTFGLRENMGDAAIYCRKTVINEWVMAIKKLSSKKEYDKYSKLVKAQAEKNRPTKKLEEFEEMLHKAARKPFKKQEYASNS